MRTSAAEPEQISVWMVPVDPWATVVGDMDVGPMTNAGPVQSDAEVGSGAANVTKTMARIPRPNRTAAVGNGIRSNAIMMSSTRPLWAIPPDARRRDQAPIPAPGRDGPGPRAHPGAP